MARFWKKEKAEEPKENPADLVREKLRQDSDIRPFPAAVTRLLAEMRRENATSASFAEIIECDPALTLRLLRMANSPLHGFNTEVRSVEHAASILGARSLKMLAMSASAATLFSDGSSAAQMREDLWLHSLGTGVVARLLAESYESVSAEDAFLASVFHDVGKLFFLDVIPEEYEAAARQQFGQALVEHESTNFGATHEEIGLRLGHAWNLAENLKVAIGYHHHITEAPVHAELVKVVHLADQLAHAWGIGSGAQSEEELLSQDVRHLLEGEVEMLEVVREKAESEFSETQEICSLSA